MLICPAYLSKIGTVVSTRNVGHEPESGHWELCGHALAELETWTSDCQPRLIPDDEPWRLGTEQDQITQWMEEAKLVALGDIGCSWKMVLRSGIRRAPVKNMVRSSKGCMNLATTRWRRLDLRSNRRNNCMNQEWQETKTPVRGQGEKILRRQFPSRLIPVNVITR
jgi:hypothetical protein